jgi:recombination protein RecT
MQAAQLGLEPTGVLGGAYLVPYKETCTLIIGYRGLIDLARRSGQIESIEAHVVYSNDRFRCHYGLSPVLEHEPAWEGPPGAVKAVYAIAKMKDGGMQLEVMTRAQVDAIKARSKTSGSGPWVTDYDEMARKTVVRRIAKYLPLTTELSDALQIDADNDPSIDAQSVDVSPRGVAGLKKIASQAAPVEEDASIEEPEHNHETGEVTEPAPAEDPFFAESKPSMIQVLEARFAECQVAADLPGIEAACAAALKAGEIGGQEMSALGSIYLSRKKALAAKSA